MKNWRPPHTALSKWSNPYHLNCHTRPDHTDECKAYEAGADAMLEALLPYFKKVLWLCETAKELIPNEENSVVVGLMNEDAKICKKCNQNRTVLLEMLLDKDNKGNRVTAHTAIENCVACKRAFHKMLAVNLMRRE